MTVRDVATNRRSRPLVRALALALALAWALFAGNSVVAQTDDQRPSHSAASDELDDELGLNRGVMSFERGRYEEALREFARAKAAGSGALYYRGPSLMALDRAKEALADLQKVQIAPGAPEEVQLDLAVARLATGDAAGAESALKEYTANHRGDVYGQYFLGVARFRQKRYDEAIENFKLASAEKTLAPYLDFYQGLASYAEDDTNYRELFNRFESSGEALGAPAGLIRQLNGMPMRSEALPGQAAGFNQPTLNGVTGPPADRRWNLAVINGYEYDTNVAIAPSIIPLGLGSNGNIPDSRWVISSFGEYRLVQRERWVMGLIGSTYDSFQFHVTQYNIQDYMGGVYSNIAAGKSWILGARYEFHETLLNGRQFNEEHRFTPNVTFKEGELELCGSQRLRRREPRVPELVVERGHERCGCLVVNFPQRANRRAGARAVERVEQPGGALPRFHVAQCALAGREHNQFHAPKIQERDLLRG
jgi:tetratricopeptide (TPR) repeat protein